MEDVASRRKLRRLNIIKNSENRLKQILNYEDKSKCTNADVAVSPTDEPLHYSSLDKIEESNSLNTLNCLTETENEIISTSLKIEKTRQSHRDHTCTPPTTSLETNTSRKETDVFGLQMLESFIEYREVTFTILAICYQIILRSIRNSSILNLCLPAILIIMETKLVATDFLKLSDINYKRNQPQTILATCLLLCGLKECNHFLNIVNILVKVVQDIVIFLFVFLVAHFMLGDCDI